MLPGKAPPREGYTDQPRTTAGASEAPHPKQEERRGGGREGEWEDLGEDSRLSTGSKERNKGRIGAGGEQTVQIITLSSGMEGEKQGGWVKGEINREKRDREDVLMLEKTDRGMGR